MYQKKHADASAERATMHLKTCILMMHQPENHPKSPENAKKTGNNQLIMRDFSDFSIKNYFISKIIRNFAARNQYGI